MYTGSGIIKIFAGRTGKPFAQRMCNYLGAQMGDATTIMFDEGNIFVRINESIRDKDVYIVQPIGREPNDEFTELLFWIDAFKRSSANSITAIIPYFSYAKGDKKDEPRVSIRARVCADCIEEIGVDRVLFMDLHADQVVAKRVDVRLFPQLQEEAFLHRPRAHARRLKRLYGVQRSPGVLD